MVGYFSILTTSETLWYQCSEGGLNVQCRAMRRAALSLCLSGAAAMPMLRRGKTQHGGPAELSYRLHVGRESSWDHLKTNSTQGRVGCFATSDSLCLPFAAAGLEIWLASGLYAAARSIAYALLTRYVRVSYPWLDARGTSCLPAGFLKWWRKMCPWNVYSEFRNSLGLAVVFPTADAAGHLFLSRKAASLQEEKAGLRPFLGSCWAYWLFLGQQKGSVSARVTGLALAHILACCSKCPSS